MTEPARARDELASSSRQLLAAVSHDLRSPLGTILLWERVLRDRFEEPGVRDRALDAIRESATAQSNLISELADVVSLLDGTATLHFERISLESMLTTGLELAMEDAQNRCVTIVRDYHTPLGHVHADRARLRRVFVNVLARGVRLTPTGHTLTIAVRRKQRSVLLAIGELDANHDTHAEVVTRELQLVLANEVLVAHGGVLHVTRPSEGGTPTFWMQLPLSRRTTKR